MGLAAVLFTTPPDWRFPRSMVLPLLYWIVVCSVAGYYAVTWAMQHLPASQVRRADAALAGCSLCAAWPLQLGCVLASLPLPALRTQRGRCPRPAARLKLPLLPPPSTPLNLTQVAAFQCLQPFVGTLLAFFFLNERPTPWDLGAIGIVAGLLLVSTDKRDVDTGAVLARLRRLISQRSLPPSKSMQLLPRWPPPSDD